MQQTQLGRTGMTVGRVGFGAIKLPLVDEDTAAEALNAALDLGINFIDTARGYKDSEAKIGRALADRREEYYLATKSKKTDADGMRSELEESLAALRTDRVDLFQLHSISSPDKWREAMAPGGALEGARRAQGEGLAGHVGITIHRDLRVMRDAVACGEFETIMLFYCPPDTEGVAPEILPLVAESGMGMIAMKALSGGMLVSEGFEDGRRAGDEDPLVSACLRFVLSHPAVDVVIPGMRNVHEVRQNARVGAEFAPMDDAERDALIRNIADKGASLRYGQECLQCGYCLPCPQGVPIPDVLRAHMMAERYPEPLQDLGREAYAKLDTKPDACVECGECSPRCPAGLDIPRRLREAKETLASM